MGDIALRDNNINRWGYNPTPQNWGSTVSVRSGFIWSQLFIWGYGNRCHHPTNQRDEGAEEMGIWKGLKNNIGIAPYWEPKHKIVEYLDGTFRVFVERVPFMFFGFQIGETEWLEIPPPFLKPFTTREEAQECVHHEQFAAQGSKVKNEVIC